MRLKDKLTLGDKVIDTALSKYIVYVQWDWR
jgi:hypothetical protein